MYKIERRPSGYILTFAGMIKIDEMQNWKKDSQIALSQESSSSFGVIIDMRDLQPLASETQDVMIEGQKLYKQKGMLRSAVILSSAIISLQFKKLAKESGIYATERYIDATCSNPIEIAINWVKDGTDPDS